MNLTVLPLDPAVHLPGDRSSLVAEGTRGGTPDHGTRPPGPRDAVASEAGPGSPAESQALSLTQAGLVGRMLVDAAPEAVASPGDLAGADLGRRVERVLKPYGVAMLPADAGSQDQKADEEAPGSR